MAAEKGSRPLTQFAGRVGDLVKGPARTIAATASIGAAAKEMAAHRVGSLVVTRRGKPVGMVTKGDMVRRVLAAGRTRQGPVAGVMSERIISLSAEKPLFEGLLLMVRHGVGHLGVTEGGRLTGVISDGDWLNFQGQHPAASFKDMERATTPAQLAKLRERANGLVRHWFGEDGTAPFLTGLITEINDRVTRRVIEITLRRMAQPPPAPFAWLALGSEGRREQTLSTDQDNGIVFQPAGARGREAARKWFLVFAGQVVDGLAICGFERCRGNTMASNPELCRTADEWQALLHRLVENPNPRELISASIYFDFRSIYGEAALVEALWRHLLGLLETNQGFLRFLAGKAEFFGEIPVDSVQWKLRRWLGRAPPPIDIKKQALSPMVRSVRVLALAHGISESNTLARLDLVQQAGGISPQQAEEVRSAYDFVMLLRLRQHFAQLERGQQPSNIVDFNRLNRLEVRFLVESLKAIHALENDVWSNFGGVSIE